ncbi:hypothetical protein BD309DRAFT_1075472 [Dichomitus squalens]|uniref:RRM domain-containing protein n=1 Tax=Dichomitus squalens TaxID=114155 RepID=A0A4Q9P8H5_9APHY|nr:uncharacterized protein DICSQDRAFT_165618 [Dichomitus squalens LYAD-421 SS1]EJF65917.1 hypothetical protein DICSQDRAFT_165618 [Dichomitus squalens LYAD-421 SS1]TBU35915.1 hypothetical protein BD311DRAFT_708445 [Dichomitus squalens]TBU50844.1 hypothetical protein BD309DRAFT_1075472 [Dichomitus squalens]TBU65762.1 hypothetical protein BD310DRAFT_836939 [Dichomitus squalens]
MASRVAGTVAEGGSKISVTLKGLSRSVLPNDLKRLCGRLRVENVASVAVNYTRFRPNGSATLAFTRPEFVPAAVKALDRHVLGGKIIRAEASDEIPQLPRTRGPKGALEAAQRAVYRGDGPNAGITGGGRTVLLYGLPARLTPQIVTDNLRNFKFAGSEKGVPAVLKIVYAQSSMSRFLIRLASVSEAYRFVRSLHMQKWRPDLYNDQFIVRASLVS